MSGGSHGYICFSIENELCGRMYDRELNDLMEDIAKLAHDLEWYDSSDISKESYWQTVTQFKQKWLCANNINRTKRLKGYIDSECNKLRSEMYLLIGAEVPSDEVTDG